ncbi:MAG: recombination and repair protein RecO [Alphaproteobacteria bacterium]|jgi:DNA repair protein RecO (recombination protein O)|nr:recombination and repair protein RecO [Alphaproteobacteria bacterium]
MSLSWQDSGIILSLRPHGENGGIVSLLTQNHGRAAGYVYGINSSRVRGMLEIGNLVSAQWSAKTHDQLGAYAMELDTSFAGNIIDSPVKLTALQSACALADKTLPEHETHPGVYEGMLALLNAFGSEIWPAAYIYWEIALLRELGFGLDFSKCVATGATENLRYVSPKSGCAVSEDAAEPYKDVMLRLPPFLRGEARLDPADVLDGLKLTGHFLLHRVFSQANSNLPEPRLRLEEKYAKMAQ